MDPGPTLARPVLELSGPRLTQSFQTLVHSSDSEAGIEAYITGLSFKASLFKETLAPERLPDLDEETIIGLCAFMGSVRRRIGGWISANDFETAKRAISALLSGAEDGSDVDERLQAFSEHMHAGPRDRWVRDMAAELLHFTDPEQYPLMTRWVWDRSANTGVLREIWFAEDIDSLTLDVPDTYATFLMLREELSTFLSENGIFRDMLFYVDLLMAQVYGDYISEQGGSFLRTDFSSELDPMEFTRRMLGLDGIDAETGRTRVKLPDGSRFVLSDLKTSH